MNKEQLFEAIGNADTEYLQKSEKTTSRKQLLLRWGSVAACFLFIAMTGIGLWQSGILNQEKAPEMSDRRWPIKQIPQTEQEGEIAIVPRWEEMPIYRQFGDVTFRGVSYSTRSGKIPADALSGEAGTATAHGYDIYTETAYTREAKLYSIKGISDQCAIAVCFEGDSNYYACVNAYYRPETLGDFIDDLNLHEIMNFGSVWYHEQLGKETALIEFVDPDASKIWELLLSDRLLPCVAEDSSRNLSSVMSVSVNIPLLGYENISLWVTADGYLVTNILDTAKIFFLGTEKTEAFIHYITENCQGYEIVFDTDRTVQIPE